MYELRGELICSSLLVAIVVLSGCGKPEGRGEIHGAAIPAAAILDKETRQASSSPVNPANKSQILFGDLHVHTTFSPDAFIMSVPLMLARDYIHPRMPATSPAIVPTWISGRLTITPRVLPHGDGKRPARVFVNATAFRVTGIIPTW